MQVFRDIHQLPAFSNAVISIGTFDGVHNGHRLIIDKIIHAAKDMEGVSVIITFDPHPRQVISPGQPVFYLTTLEEKLTIFESYGIDVVVVVPFSREFSEMAAEDYAEHFLIKNFNPRIIVFGYDHHFGKDRKGDIHLLKKIATNYQIRVEEIPAHIIDNITVSSSKIRKSLADGNVQEATQLLGYEYSITGIVVKGDQIGRTLGYPTANIHVEDVNKLIPGNGVYIVYVKFRARTNWHYGLLNIGTRPTFNKTEKRIEVYILDFDETIYGEEITVGFIQYLRPDIKFDSKEELVKAIEKDHADALQFIRSINS